MKKIKIGFLPLYVKLYDDVVPGIRPRLEAFYETMAKKLEEQGMEVIRAPFCRLEGEFLKTVADFEEAGAQCIVTLHMAYSPSLECVKALTETTLPIVVMDTTETYEFDPMVDSGELMYNHGIHGVMDMCNLLLRNNKQYAIAAGHYLHSDVVERTCGYVRASVAAHALNGIKVGTYGGEFAGMGDFQAGKRELSEWFGVDLIEADDEEIKGIRNAITDAEVDAEIAFDDANYERAEVLNETNYRENTKDCLAIRKWIDKHGLNAFSMNFLKFTAESGLKSVPFMEACKAMTRGIGYAGEGDALDAAIMGAIYKAYDQASFCEIFCPDWKGNTVMISHMGEMNYAVSDIKPQLNNVAFNYTNAAAPVVGYAKFRAGKAIYANVCRDTEGYCMVITPIEMLEVKEDSFKKSMRGWFKPSTTVADLLEGLSINGATHHSLLIYEASVEEIAHFASLLGMKVIIL